MPESIISQFRREYNSPIETDRQVNNINARDAINILTRWEGMNVYVISEGITYSLVGGLDNTNWQAVAGIAEAPIDGQAYIRKDGGWDLMPEVTQQNPLVYFLDNDIGNPAGSSISLFDHTFSTDVIDVGDIIVMRIFGVAGSDSDDSIKYRFGSAIQGVTNPPTGYFIFDVNYVIKAIGVNGSARISYSLNSDTGDFINIAVNDETGINISNEVLVGVVAGGTSENSVVLKSGTLFHYKNPI